MDVFTYEPIDLGGPAFRLMRLTKGEGPDIECELFQGWLRGDDAISYEALSYTWGGTELSASVTLNGQTLGVTENLYLALLHLRSQEKDRILWIDAICIDQGNKREIGHQVQHMGDIYSHANEVIFWLGPGTYETNVLMESLGRLQKKSLEKACRSWELSDTRWVDLWLSVLRDSTGQYPDVATRQREGLDLLLQRPWFRRVWILQEVANARNARVCCGTKSVSARFFALAPLLLHTKPEPQCQAVLDIMPGPSRKGSWWSEKRDLYNLVQRFSGSQAGDPRDMVYALLDISSDAHDTDRLRPDYTKDIRQVVRDTAFFLFGVSDVSYRTIPELLQEIDLLNNAFLLKVAETSTASKVGDVLMQRGHDIVVTEAVVQAAANNRHNGKEVMALLLQQRGREIPVTNAVVAAAARNPRSGKDLIYLLYQQRSGEVVKAAVSNGKVAMALLQQQKGSELKVIREIIKATGANNRLGGGVTNILARQAVEAFEITDELMVEFAGSFEATAMELLLRKRRAQAKVSEEMLIAAAENTFSGVDTMSFLLACRGSEFKITEGIVKAAAGNDQCGAYIILYLLRRFSSEIMVTEEVVKATAKNKVSKNEIMEQLIRRAQGEFIVTEGLVMELARSFNADVIKLLLRKHETEVMVTEAIIEAAQENSTDVARLLLRHKRRSVLWRPWAQEMVGYTWDPVRGEQSS